MGCQSGLTGARFDIKMRLVKSSAFFVDKGIDVDYKRYRCWRVGREARQRTANPSTAVRIRYLPFGLSKESLFFCHVMHRPPKHHRLRVAINREGVLFVFFWLALGAAAIYSGNAGLMILFCMLTAAFALVSALAHRNMQPLEVVRRFPEDIFAQRNAHIDVLMTNRSAIPVYGLHLYERFDDAHCIGPIYVARLAPGETARARYMCIFDARGVAQFSTFEVRSRFPVPIFEWRQTIEASDMARVYPRYEPGTDLIAFCEEESTAPPPYGSPEVPNRNAYDSRIAPRSAARSHFVEIIGKKRQNIRRYSDSEQAPCPDVAYRRRAGKRSVARRIRTRDRPSGDVLHATCVRWAFGERSTRQDSLSIWGVARSMA